MQVVPHFDAIYGLNTAAEYSIEVSYLGGIGLLSAMPGSFAETYGQVYGLKE
jgi:hypothetical protein